MNGEEGERKRDKVRKIWRQEERERVIERERERERDSM